MLWMNEARPKGSLEGGGMSDASPNGSLGGGTAGGALAVEAEAGVADEEEEEEAEAAEGEAETEAEWDAAASGRGRFFIDDFAGAAEALWTDFRAGAGGGGRGLFASAGRSP